MWRAFRSVAAVVGGASPRTRSLHGTPPRALLRGFRGFLQPTIWRCSRCRLRNLSTAAGTLQEAGGILPTVSRADHRAFRRLASALWLAPCTTSGDSSHCFSLRPQGLSWSLERLPGTAVALSTDAGLHGLMFLASALFLQRCDPDAQSHMM